MEDTARRIVYLQLSRGYDYFTTISIASTAISIRESNDISFFIYTFCIDVYTTIYQIGMHHLSCFDIKERSCLFNQDVRHTSISEGTFSYREWRQEAEALVLYQAAIVANDAGKRIAVIECIVTNALQAGWKLYALQASALEHSCSNVLHTAA